MTFAQRFALVLFAAFFLSSAALSLVTFIFAPRLLRRAPEGAASARATMLALCRLLPATVSLAVTALVLGPGYFRYEQRGVAEETGYGLLLLAGGGLLLIAMSMTRAVRSVRRTSSLRRAWMATARRTEIPNAGIPAFALDLSFPLVAVLGVLRPRLFISSAVLRECSASEIAAVIEHERAHVRRRDNAVRLLMDAAPDMLSVTRVSSALAAAWHRAVEHRADDAAARKLDLASALVKVARMAVTPAPIELPASALYRGEGDDSINDRVRRLVGAPATIVRSRWMTAMTASAIAIAAMISVAAATGAASRLAHAVLEVAVSRLP